VSKIIESLREDLISLHKAGAIGKVTLREFDALCPPQVREFSAADVRQLRQRLNVSQPVFAHHLHISVSTVRKWEQGETRPAGPALKLLNLVADRGLRAVL
jgi:putative transcriptional regulator